MITLKSIIDVFKDPGVRGATLELVESAVEMLASSISTDRRLERGDLIDGAVPYGPPKKNGGHNHIFNKEEDRTPAQKAADIRRRKS